MHAVGPEGPKLNAAAGSPGATGWRLPRVLHELLLNGWRKLVACTSSMGLIPRLVMAVGIAIVAAGISHDFAFTNHLFSPDRVKLGWRVFGRRDAPPIRAQIVTSADSSVKTLSELAQEEVAFPGPEAFIAYKLTYAHLINSGVPVKVVFGGNMDGAFGQLFSGKVKAVGANSQLVDGYAQREKKQFRVLWTSGPFYDLALMASPRVSEAEMRAVAKAFFSMHRDPQGRAVLERARELIGAPSPVVFVPATEADYQNYRQFYNTAPQQLR